MLWLCTLKPKARINRISRQRVMHLYGQFSCGASRKFLVTSVCRITTVYVPGKGKPPLILEWVGFLSRRRVTSCYYFACKNRKFVLLLCMLKPKVRVITLHAKTESTCYCFACKNRKHSRISTIELLLNREFGSIG